MDVGLYRAQLSIMTVVYISRSLKVKRQKSVFFAAIFFNFIYSVTINGRALILSGIIGLYMGTIMHIFIFRTSQPCPILFTFSENTLFAFSQ